MEADEIGLEAVNIGNPEELTVNGLLEAIVAITGSNAPVVHRPLPTDDPRRRKPDIRRAIAGLGWRPRVDLEDGLRRTCAWFAEEIGAPIADARRARVLSVTAI